MTNQFEPLDDVLSELAGQHRQIGPPRHLEARLRSATRSMRPAVSVWRQAVALAAAIVLALALGRGGRPTVERSAEFLPLPGSETLPPPLGTSLLRLRVPLGDLRQYGFDVPPPSAADMVSAEFVVGDDGVARAVRFVR
jgi:hypothetical protein